MTGQIILLIKWSWKIARKLSVSDPCKISFLIKSFLLLSSWMGVLIFHCGGRQGVSLNSKENKKLRGGVRKWKGNWKTRWGGNSKSIFIRKKEIVFLNPLFNYFVTRIKLTKKVNCNWLLSVKTYLAYLLSPNLGKLCVWKNFGKKTIYRHFLWGIILH